MIRLISLLLLSLLLSSCAGSGFYKKATLMPDSIGLETDLDSSDGFKSRLVEVRANWTLK